MMGFVLFVVGFIFLGSGNTGGLFWIVILDLGSCIRIPGPMVGLKFSYWCSCFSISVVLFAYDA